MAKRDKRRTFTVYSQSTLVVTKSIQAETFVEACELANVMSADDFKGGQIEDEFDFKITAVME